MFKKIPFDNVPSKYTTKFLPIYNILACLLLTLENHLMKFSIKHIVFIYSICNFMKLSFGEDVGEE